MPLLIAGFVLYLAVFILVVAYALWKGGKDEKRGAATMLVGAVLSQIASVLGPRWAGPDLGLLAVDVLILCAFVVIAYGSRKFWPIWASASQLVAVLTHVGVILDQSIGTMAYATTQPLWVFPMLAALAVGTYKHRQSSL